MNKFQKLRALRRPALVAALSAFAVSSSHAAGVTIDLADVLATITTGITTITTLGVAVLSLVVVVKLFKWVKGAM